MKIYTYTPGVQIAEKNTVVALGFFDGVHAAHRKLLKAARELSQKEGLVFTVFTFRSENGCFKGDVRLYSTDEKLELLKDIGAEVAVVADFPSVAKIEAEDFVKKSLIGDLHCRAAVAGYDFRFGYGAKGDANLLSSLLGEAGASCHIEEEQKIGNERISSTKIKQLLEHGNVEEARLFLGAPYFIKTEVKHGIGLGRKLGFPTVNCDFEPRSVSLKVGVYRTAVDISGKLYTGITNVGTCPTFSEGRKIHAETYIVGYSGDLYGQSLRIFFLGYLREEKKFSDPKDLIMQINIDKNTVIKQNGDLKWQEIGQS